MRSLRYRSPLLIDARIRCRPTASFRSGETPPTNRSNSAIKRANDVITLYLSLTIFKEWGKGGGRGKEKVLYGDADE